MSYTDFFGSNTVPPAGSGLLVLTLLADQAFCWPSDYNGTLPGVASIIQVSAASGNSLILPDAQDQSTGFDFLIRNVGAYPLQVKGSSGDTIGTIPAGGSHYLYLTDNSTAQGVYGLIAFGVGTSSVDSATLVGYGIKAVGTSLNQSHPVLTYSVSTTIDSSHRAQLVVFNGGTVTASLMAASSLGNDYFFILKNLGTGTVTIDPAGSETIDGQSAFSVQPGESMVVCCSGSSWYVVGYGRSTVYQFTQLVKDVSAGGTINLTSSEASNKLITFTGNPASGVTVVVPGVVSIYYLMSSISTAQSITFKTAAGTGVGIPQSARIIAMCDGVNVVSAQSVQSNSSLSLTDGTSSAPSLSFSSATNTGIYKSGASGVGISISGTPQFTLDGTNLLVPNARLGIGVTPGGSYKLQVQGSQYNYNASAFTPTNSTVGAASLVLGGAFGGGLVQVDGATYGATWLQSGYMAWGLGSSAGVLTALTLTSSQLNAKGDEILVGQTGNATQKRMRLQNSSRDICLCLNTDNSIALWDQTAGVNRWVINAAGDFTVVGDVSIYKDTINLGYGSASTKSLIFSNNIRNVNLELSADGTTFRMVDYGAGVARWTTNVAGDFIAAGNVTAYSDERLKHDVQVIHGALDKVKALRGVTFRWNRDNSSGIGFIAQELEQVCPELVHNCEDIKSVAYGNATALLVEAVKELSTQVAILKGELAAVHGGK